jgi:hypothetical protein
MFNQRGTVVPTVIKNRGTVVPTVRKAVTRHHGGDHRATILASLLLTVLWNATAGADDVAFFKETIEPILQNNCYDCHSHDSGEASGGLVLDSKAGWTVGGDSGPAIVPSRTRQAFAVASR